MAKHYPRYTPPGKAKKGKAGKRLHRLSQPERQKGDRRREPQETKEEKRRHTARR
jgi:hypothetical protein